MASGATAPIELDSSVARQASRADISDKRIHYLDNLRASAMLGGVFLHGAFAYAQPAQTFWLATDPESSILIDAGIWFLHLFRMGLFFLLAGYFAKRAVAQKGFEAFALNRTLRLLVPFVIFYPLLLGAMGIVIQFALSFVQQPAGLLGLIASGSDIQPDETRSMLPGTMHLWFLYYLIAFSTLSFLSQPLKAIRIDWLFERPWLMLLAPPVLIPAILWSGIPLSSPESLVPLWWPFGFYGMFYWAGWHLFCREHLLERYQSYAWPLLAVCLGLFVAYYHCLPDLNLSELLRDKPRLPFWKIAIGTLLTAYLSVGLTACSWLLGKRYFWRRVAGMSLLADASYWVYLIHLPVVIFLQTLLIPVPWNVWIKLFCVLVGTLAFCLATYLVFVRYTPLGWVLHGKKTFP